MTPRKNIIAVLKGEKPDIIPILSETVMDSTVQQSLNLPATEDPAQNLISQASFFGNSSLDIGLGLKKETISRDESQHRFRYETGAEWKIGYQPTFFRKATSLPIVSPEQAFTFKMPDPNDAERADDLKMKAMVQSLHDAGYFVRGGVVGAWQGIYYTLAPFESVLMWMLTEPQATHRLFDMMRFFNVGCARRLLGWGVDCIATASDLGTAVSLLFSPEMFREYVFPWLKELADLCHQHNAFLHLHSHGHIEVLMDGIVEAGVDIINPVGPSDNNDLSMYKERWGKDITINGGISTTIPSMSNSEIKKHIGEVISAGRKGGRFFPCTESGIPPMPVEKIKYYIDTLRQECSGGYG